MNPFSFLFSVFSLFFLISCGTDSIVVVTVSPSQGDIEGGTVVTFLGSGLSAATQVTFGGTSATALTVNSDNSLSVTAPAHGAGAVDLVISSATSNTTVTSGYTYTDGRPALSSLTATSGPKIGGTTITLTGVNFTGATSVTFDGTEGTSLNVSSSTSATIITPAHAAGAVDVIITTPEGSSTLAGGFTYLEVPILTSVSPTTVSASGGTAITLTGTRFTGTTGVTVDGVAATSVNVVNATTVTAVTPSHVAGATSISLTTGEGTTTLSSGLTFQTTAVGQSTFGGVIGCLAGAGNLIAASSDNSSSIGWGGSGTATAAQSNADGSTNTTTIVTALGAGTYAAKTCDDFEVDSQGNTPCEAGNACYNDWFLPALDELNCLYDNKAAIGGFAGASYWSSTEFVALATNNANAVVFTDGSNVSQAKVSALRARCVRTFVP